MKSGRRSDPKYELEIHWIPEDHCYVVKVPELEGCMTHGRTIQEAVAKAREVIAGYIESLKARACRFHPASRPVHQGEISGTSLNKFIENRLGKELV